LVDLGYLVKPETGAGVPNIKSRPSVEPDQFDEIYQRGWVKISNSANTQQEQRFASSQYPATKWVLRGSIYIKLSEMGSRY
jgi:hypothetical protein